MSSPCPANAQHPPLPWRFLLTLFGVIFALQLITYTRAFSVKPAGDDFGPPLFDYFVGNEQGPFSFYLKSYHGFSYRPTQALLAWAAVSMNPADPIAWLHSLNFVGMGIILIAAMLWIREFPLSRAGATVVALVLCFHPTLVTPLGSLDGFATPWVSGLIWLGTWCVHHFRERLWLGLGLASLVFALAVGLKEFAFAMAPLAGVAMLFFRRRRRLPATLLAGGWIALLAGVYMLIRHAALPPAELRPNVDSRILQSFRDLGENLAAYAGGLFFTGNSVWVFVNQSPMILLLTGIWILICSGVIAWGVALRWRSTQCSAQANGSLRTWIAFFLVSLPAASFPASVTNHISEMYVTPIIFPLAMLAGIAADGFRTRGIVTRAAVAALSLLLLGGAILSIQFKLALLQQVGDKADVVLQAALAHIPAGEKNVRAALLFRKSDDPPRPRYSVYRMSNAELLQEISADWVRRGDQIYLELVEVSSADDFTRRAEYDLTLLWNDAARRFERLPNP